MKKIYLFIIFICFGIRYVNGQTITASPTPSILIGGFTVQATVSSTLVGITGYSWTALSASAGCAPSQTVSAASSTACLFSFPCCTNFTISCVPYTGNTAGAPVSKVIMCGLQTTSVVELEANTIHVFPNPSHGKLVVKGITADTEFTLRNVEGKLLLKQSLRKDTEIDVSAYAAGLYFYSLNGGQAEKLLIE